MTYELQQRITVNENICHGKPCISNTRIMVTNILSLFAGGYDIPKILTYYPELQEEDVRAAIEYSIESIQNEDVQLLQV